jgi:hypothetical protein
LSSRFRALRRSIIGRAFAERGLSGLVHLAEEMDESSLGRVVAAPTDFEFLLRLLERPEALDLLHGEGPLNRARLRGLRARDELLRAEGGVLSAQAAAEHLQISRQAVDKRRKAGTLLGLSIGRHGYGYPAWQFTRDGILRGLERVLAALKDHDPWMKASFMLGPNAHFEGKTPLALLRQGKIEDAVKAARVFGHQGGN